jgi:hypothetical protein
MHRCDDTIGYMKFIGCLAEGIFSARIFLTKVLRERPRKAATCA